MKNSRFSDAYNYKILFVLFVTQSVGGEREEVKKYLLIPFTP